MSKVEQRRSRKLIEAVENNNWETVTRLLAQPFNNLERKERHYGVISLNLTISNDGKDTEILDLYSDNTYNPIEQLLIKERNEFLINALSKLSKDDLQIFLEITLNGTSALQLTKETSFKSHKTIKKRYENILKFLKEELEKYF
ncbi:sigma-70 family RNA polymerase sigma factor [Streptococcus infantis]|uniref:sigma-70 family RNA polymerase sigma factor n=1 Tax=Streptococcus infantis TaxID=68892 RepID=UPI0039C4A36F